jgi:hypothetical protein
LKAYEKSDHVSITSFENALISRVRVKESTSLLGCVSCIFRVLDKALLDYTQISLLIGWVK